MSMAEWAAHGVVILLLAVALPLAWRLNTSLARLRGEREALAEAAASLGDATRAAESALLRLRAAAELAGRQVAEKTAAAEPLRDDLRFLIERGESLADRLDSGVRAARGAPAETPREAIEQQIRQVLAGRR